ncbi:MAG: hypothetical protein IPO90_10530 [Flavobacteriales bacterium]|nr:hypothetical protein [Flavobacteriales bacterium]
MITASMYNHVHARYDQLFNYWYAFPTRGVVALDSGFVEAKFTCPTMINVPGDGSVTISLKSDNELLGKRTYHYQNGFFNDCGGPGAIGEVIEGRTVYCELHVEGRALADSINSFVISVDTLSGFQEPPEAADISGQLEDGLGIHTLTDSISPLFGNHFRGWGQFIYNGNDAVDDPIDVSVLTFDGAGLAADGGQVLDVEGTENLDNVQNISNYDPTQAEFLVMFAKNEDNAWVGYDEFTYLKADTISCSRLGDDDLTNASYSSDEMEPP